MTIAIDMVGTNNESGTKTYNINFCKYLLNENSVENIYVFVCKDYLSELNLNYKSKKIKFIAKPNILNFHIFKILWMQFIFPFELKFLKVDKLFSTMNFCPIISKLFKIKIIIAIHSNLPWKFFSYLPGSYLKKIFIKFLMELSIKVSDKIIVPSNYAKKEIEEILNINVNKVFSVYLGLDENFIGCTNQDQSINNFDYNNYILSVLSCTRYHNIINLLKAFKLFQDEKKTNYRFVLVSQILDQKYFDEIKNYISNNFDLNQIIFFHNLDKNYLKKLYKEAKFYMFSSYCESFGLTSIEAMSQKIPIAISNQSSLPEINGKAAIYFDPDNVLEIKDCIIKMIFNNDLRNELISKGKSHFYKFKWSTTFNETLKILRNT